MNRRAILAFVGIVLLSLCVFSCFQWIGVTHSHFMQLTTPNVGACSWPLDEHVVGVRWGVVDGYGWTNDKNMIIEDPGPISRVTHWGIVHPIEMPYDTHLRFSFRGEDGAYLGHGPYGLGEWSFPIWPLAVALLIPGARAIWKRIHELRANAANLCAVCGYDLRASVDRCPECGTPIPLANGRRGAMSQGNPFHSSQIVNR